MEKFLQIQNVPVMGNQLVAVNNIKTVTTASAIATTVVITYSDGTATTITTAAQVGADVYQEIRLSLMAALRLSWQNPYLLVTLPKDITDIVNA